MEPNCYDRTILNQLAFDLRANVPAGPGRSPRVGRSLSSPRASSQTQLTTRVGLTIDGRSTTKTNNLRMQKGILMRTNWNALESATQLKLQK